MTLRVLAAAAVVTLPAGVAAWAQMATADRVREAGFWPTKGTSARSEYVGAAACARCHKYQSEAQAETNMARTLKRAAESEVLVVNPLLKFRAGARTYEIATREGASLYSVTDGERSASVPLGWAFGAGKVGQTWVYEKDGAVHESRVSWLEGIRGPGFTPARAVVAPRDPWDALGRPVPAAEARRCFGCHTTAATAGRVFDTRAMTLGVQCEACHGPGRAHVAGVESGRIQAGTIVNPGKLEPADAVDFCGACHASFWDVKLANEKGIAQLRSQPYRLQSSRCWTATGGEERITCTACHDVHRPLVREVAAYDPKCVACHAAQGTKPTPERPAAPCPVAVRDCTTCHMPKYDVPDMHHAFTDHQIRVVPRPARP